MKTIKIKSFKCQYCGTRFDKNPENFIIGMPGPMVCLKCKEKEKKQN